MKMQARHCWSCTIAIPRRKRLTPDRRARCPRRSTNSTSFSPAWDQVLRQNDAANPSNKTLCGRGPKTPAVGELQEVFRSNGVTPAFQVLRKTNASLSKKASVDPKVASDQR